MNARISALLASVVVLLSGCVTPLQLPVPLQPQTLAAPSIRVGIVVAKLPVVDTHFPGASCLLCLAAASIANSQLTTHTKTLPYENFPQVKDELAALLTKKGVAVTLIDSLDIAELPGFKGDAPNFARKDYTGLKAKYNIDKLLVVAVNLAGIERNYSAYIAVSDPKARLAGSGYMVNLNNNELDWYLPLNVVKASDGKWDEPPKFPGLTNAYFQTLEMSRDLILAPFLK